MGNVEYYDVLGDLDFPYFHWGGIKATDRLMELCGTKPGMKLLSVGCGTGYIACYIAENYGCHVTGVDISSKMIDQAKRRAQEKGIQDKVEFHVANATELPFEDNIFDIIYTEFVTSYLDQPEAFNEYSRILKPNGTLGIDELYITEEIPVEHWRKIVKAQKSFTDATGIPLELATKNQWQKWLIDSGFTGLIWEDVDYSYDIPEYVKALGGWFNAMKLFLRMWFLLFNPSYRERSKKIGDLQQVLTKDPQTMSYGGTMLLVGRKE